jgi:transcriptional regulator with PAS, ATPase and Fis domain
VSEPESTIDGPERPRRDAPDDVTHELVVFRGDDLRVYELPREGDVTIGRAEGNTVRLDDPSVSRQHAVLRLGPTIVVEDLGGPNGTFFRGKPEVSSVGETLGVRQLVRRRAEVAVGDRLIFGAVSAVLRRAPVRRIPRLDAAAAQRDGVVVKSPAMLRVYEQAARAAQSNISVLLCGETGVGKDVLARAIHAHSRRANAPFMSINCAAIAESLLETELFGCEKGAFTGALQARAGLLEAASPGTVFLDEVGELSPAIQAKLLRVLEERIVMRVGATRGRAIDVRFVAATNRDLEAAIGDGTFREDLYFRLNGITLTIPPLRERREEIEPFVRAFLAAADTELGRTQPLGISEQALEALVSHDWPGNVRELRNTIARSAVLCATDTIHVADLPAGLGRPRSSSTPGSELMEAKQAIAARFHAEIKAAERARIQDALKRSAGNQTRAAELLQVSRRTLVARLGELGIDRPRKRGKPTG